MTPQKITTAPLPYLLYTPKPAAKLPLILFLHGSGERGDDLDHVGDHGLSEILANLPEAALVVAPQCPANARWTDHLHALETILDAVIAEHPADKSRVYLTGLSLGGQGAWFLAARAPQRFAALVPVCGRSNPGAADRLKNLPTWTFHGADDNIVPLNESTKMVSALEAVGGTVKLTMYPGTGHNSWTRAYSEPELYMWLFAQSQTG
ncbi:MAG: hypothetical protein AVDCRST_MAG86-3480 [uncultured Truepera sp.]|uniref:Dienelactone hydrolase domain-containing protein n=1 Tax=uncultured Truepera sp. TaxID=543023 RepID=A0A6J4VQH6_9DEIN|nr:MAG: hypothetical protein AVDCRST_MAG86-3480 [uncultured Truepera sp.]